MLPEKILTEKHEKQKNRKIRNHKLNIETGRYDKISRCDRICPVCGLNIEDEIRFLFNCPKYSSIKDDFFNKIENRIPSYEHIPISTLLICYCYNAFAVL